MPTVEGVKVQLPDVAPGYGLPSRYHWRVYGGVPLETVETKFTNWPRLIVADIGLIVTEGGGRALNTAFRVWFPSIKTW